MLTKALKAVLLRLLPRTYRSWQQSFADRRLRRVITLLEKECGLIVQTGPFVGMTYVSEAICSSLVPKLLGSYEAELHALLTQIVTRDYQTVIDVGCAEGYYAVGLALRLPRARVYAFDINARARELCAKLADCEGCELQLLDPALAPELKKSDLLVELHDTIDPRITPTILSRFTLSHEITLVDSGERDPTAFPILRNFDHLTQRTAVAEFRDAPMQWGYLQAKSAA